VCRHDHGLSWAEFQSLTLPQLEALEERRMVGIRYARFNAGLLASTYYNAHRSEDSEPLEVWDFLPGFERDPAEVEREKMRRSVKHGVRVAFGQMGTMTVERARQVAASMIRNMEENGTEDADAIVREVFEEVIQQPYTE
jgi:hypothetical protein